MKWDERTIAAAIARQVFQRKCLLLVDNCQWARDEADVLAVTRDLRLIDVEIKISRADLKADAAKEKWWHRGFGTIVDGKWVRPPATAKLWPHRIWKHYYAMPAEIWKPELLAAIHSPMSGVILLREQANGIAVARVERRSKPDRDAKRLNAEEVLDIARLANLRLWDAYATIASLSRERLAA